MLLDPLMTKMEYSKKIMLRELFNPNYQIWSLNFNGLYVWVFISSNLGVSLSSTTRTFLCCCSWWWFCVKIICCCFCLLATALQVALSKPSLISSSTDDPCFPECILPFLKKRKKIVLNLSIGNRFSNLNRNVVNTYSGLNVLILIVKGNVSWKHKVNWNSDRIFLRYLQNKNGPA